MIAGPSKLLDMMRTKGQSMDQTRVLYGALLESLDSMNSNMIDALMLLERPGAGPMTRDEFTSCMRGAHALIQASWIGAPVPEETVAYLAQLKASAAIHEMMNPTRPT